MSYRIHDILLVASEYDAFIFEKDGQLVEKIYQDYYALGLHFIPLVTRASNLVEAMAILKHKRIDLVITMMDLPDTDAIKLASVIKKAFPQLPVVLLINDHSFLTSAFANQQKRSTYSLFKSIFDGTFFWTGDSELFFAIVKYIEDTRNIDVDIGITGLIEVILIIEDSVDYYSKFLPTIYKEVMKQTQLAVEEGTTQIQKIRRTKTRPKILLANTYEEAIKIFKKYHKNILGIISDINFPKNGVEDPEAGLHFANFLKDHTNHIPLLFMSEEETNKTKANAVDRDFINKKSHLFKINLTKFIRQHMGFGDFIFKLPAAEKEVGKAANLRQLQHALEEVPIESVIYHAKHNHISAWLSAHGELSLANKLRPIKIDKFPNEDSLRTFLVQAISNYRKLEQHGAVVKFQFDNWDSTFIQIGNGALGGKARGIAFANYLLATRDICTKYSDINIGIPHTVVITTDFFDQLIEANNLYECMIIDDDQTVIAAFLNATIPTELKVKLVNFLKYHDFPLAIRSSGLLEDSHFLPFAGIYSTYMIPNNSPELNVRYQQLETAIKLVYASVFLKRSKSYIALTPYKLEHEKMAVIIQNIVGKPYGSGFFYPNISGVVESYNFYPFSYMRADQGVARIALGLGKTIMEGERSLRFSPSHPDILPQLSTVEEAFSSTQKNFWCLNLNTENFIYENETLSKQPLSVALSHGTLQHLACTYDQEDHQLKNDINLPGPKILTFENILKYNVIPLSPILHDLLAMFKQAIGKDLQIEFALNLSPLSFQILQVRPLGVRKETVKISDNDLSRDNLIVYNKMALGNGIFNQRYLVIVKRDQFNFQYTQQIAEEISAMNTYLQEIKASYTLIGPGRWGSCDNYLGIPVQWNQISRVKLIIELVEGLFTGGGPGPGGGTKKYIDPSQGGHFFHNITSRSIGYFTLKEGDATDFINWSFLNTLPAIRESAYVKLVEYTDELTVKIDGKNQIGIITLNNTPENWSILTTSVI
ncbi:MAG: histidine kinase [Oligoflexia bacterium]|nr:histidine kinase [Oligoflexia bacterium]